jgi:uncharacterized protein (TIGR02996 family)
MALGEVSRLRSKPVKRNDALLQAIFENPDDDAPRLTYADWLDRQGEPTMAEFIRLQEERARLPDVPVSDRARDLERQATRLLRAHRARWFGPLHQAKGKLISSPRAERGLLEMEVRGTASSFLQKADALLAGLVLPYVLRVHLTGVRSVWSDLLASPYLSRASFLDLGGEDLGAEEAEALAGCEQLRHLQQLWLFDNQIGDAGAAALAGSPHLGRLDGLAIVRDEVTASSLTALLRSRQLRALKWLWLDSKHLRLDGVRPYRAASGGPRLTTLSLKGSELDDAAATWAASSPGFAGLGSLSLQGGRIGPRGAAALAESRYLAGLYQLDLSGNPVGDDGVRSLAASPHLTALETLWLDKCGVGRAGAQALLKAPHPAGWTYLSNNPLDAATRKRLENHEPSRFSV